MTDKTFFQTVQIELIKREMKLRDLYLALGSTNSYNWFWQVVRGQRNSPETISKIKQYLNIH